MRISAEAAEGRVGVGGRCGSVRRTDGEHIDWRSSIAPWASGPAPKRRRRGSISPRATPDAPRASTGSNNNTFPRVIQKLIHSAPHHGGDVGSGRSPADALRHPRRRPHHLHHRGHQTRVPSEGASLPSDPIRAPPMDTRSPPRSSAPYKDDHRRPASFRIRRRSPRIRTRTTARTRSSSGSSARGMSSPTRTIAKSTTHSWHHDVSTS